MGRDEGECSQRSTAYWLQLLHFPNVSYIPKRELKQDNFLHVTQVSGGSPDRSNAPFGISGLPRSESRYAAS